MANKANQQLGLGVFLGLALLPSFFWFLMQPASSRFTDLTTSLTSLGQLTGLIGMALFCLVIILSARLKFLEDYFFGLNNIYLKHHFYGGLSLVLLLFHPLFLAFRYLQFSTQAAALSILPGNDLAVNFGIFGLLLLIFLLVLTFYFRPAYQLWRFTHKFLALAFLLAGLHVWFIPSDISRNFWLRSYLLSLISLAILTILYRTIFGVFLVKRSKFKVTDVQRLGQNIIEVTLFSELEKLVYQPGQFIYISFLQSGLSREVHPFSLSSSPDQSELKITVKVLGDFTTSLMKLKVGALAKIEGPFGKFSYNLSANKQQIWIAGGIGITPFLSMARHLKTNQGYQIDLLYCAKNTLEMLFIEELKTIEVANQQLKVTLFCSDEHGRINVAALQEICGELGDKEFFICGPDLMMQDLKTQLKNQAIPTASIHTEEFSV